MGIGLGVGKVGEGASILQGDQEASNSRHYP